MALVAAIVAAGCCYLTGYGPVLRCQTAMRQAMLAAGAEPHGSTGHDTHAVDRLRDALLAAVAADPLSAEPCRMLAEYELERWKADPTPQLLRRFAAAADVMLRLRPRSSTVRQRVGLWYLEIYGQTHQRADAETAAGYLKSAVERYPASALLNSQWAEVLNAAGQTDEARQVAAKALELDAATPHADKQLPAAERKRMQDLANGSR